MMNKIITFIVLVSLISGLLVINSCKKDPVPPTLTTSAVTNITINSFTSGGIITKDGGAAVTSRGICWSTSTNPTISDSHTSDGQSIGSFASNVTDLTPNTLYHVRAYATNKAGTAYGADVTFTTTPIVVPTLTTTDVTGITLTTAASGGNITADGGGAITARGVCWATTANPIIGATNTTTDGTGTGVFTSAITGLLPGTGYHVRAYATNSAGTAYGADVPFTTTAVAVPTVTTTAITGLTLTSAISGGNVSADGGAAVTARGVCWAITANPVIGATNTTSNGTGTGVFTSNLAGLLPGTAYHVRAYATNSAGTAYGADVPFTTTAVGLPTLTTDAITGLTLTSAISGGNITADGGGAVTARGVCWATTANPVIGATNTTTNGTGTGVFVSNITGLVPGTAYHVRAYATNSAGTAYGADVPFTTNPVLVPTLTTTAVTGVTLTTAATGGNITADGGGTVTARGVCWGTTLNPVIGATNTTTNGTGTGVFTSAITGLLPGTAYHVRAYATNSAGTAYGADIPFTTNPVLVPTLTTTAVTGITLTTAATGGNITADGGGAVTARGVCWATTANPVIGATNTTTNGTGTGVFVSNITGLVPGTAYHVRAYATNSAGTAYGADLPFTTTAAVAPTLTTVAISALGATNAVSGGVITSDGGATVTVSGIVWGTTALPVVGGPNSTTDGTLTGAFASSLTGLTDGTTYYVRSYATNSIGTGYGNQLTLLTKVADNDGNTYNTVMIGNQVWMAENLKTTKFNTGAAIPLVDLPLTAWIGLTTPAYSWYANDIANKPTYGALYNWYAVNTLNLCPTGWKVPTDAEYMTMEGVIGIPADTVGLWGYRGTISQAGSKLKNTTGWAVGPPDENGTNTSGFSSLPAGYRYYADGTFQQQTHWAYIWTGTEVDAATAYYRRLDNTIWVLRGGVSKSAGKSVRCIK
jgi:uncharacterized protein (TIGR02145 family)